MPELPEVETTRRGISPHVIGHRIERVIIRQRNLRWPIPRRLEQSLPGQTVCCVARRGKYLLLTTAAGTAILHLGMSGSLRIIDAAAPAAIHEHVDIVLDNGRCLRFKDPRRFGALLWTTSSPAAHWLLSELGPEPLSTGFTGKCLYAQSRGRRLAIKSFLMDSKIVAGVGNIYANEALFLAGIHPQRAAGRVSRDRYERLAQAVRAVLRAAIREGGTTLRDFINGEGKPGYFRQLLSVYGKTGDPCPRCGQPIRERRIGQRSSFFCPTCQH